MDAPNETAAGADLVIQVGNKTWPRLPHLLALAVVASGEAAPTVVGLEQFQGWPADLVEALFLEGEAAGVVEAWAAEEASVTLTALGAERLAVKLNDAGTSWVPEAQRLPCQRRVYRRGGLTATDSELSKRAGDLDAPNSVLDSMQDPAAREPWEILSRAELAERATARRKAPLAEGLAERNIPLPTVLLGQRLQWPAAAWQASADRPAPRPDCPGCHASPRPNEYCLICDRYGREWMLPKVHLAPKRVPSAKAKAKLTRKAERAERARAAKP